MLQKIRSFILLLLFTLCTACFEVDDAKEQWQSATADLALVGKWQVQLMDGNKKVEEFHFEFIAKEDHLAIKDLKEQEKRLLQARSFTHDGLSILLTYDELQKQMLFYPYQTTAKGAELFIPNKQSFTKLQAQFPKLVYLKSSGIIGMHHVTHFDDAFLSRLVSMTKDRSAWIIAQMTALEE